MTLTQVGLTSVAEPVRTMKGSGTKGTITPAPGSMCEGKSWGSSFPGETVSGLGLGPSLLRVALDKPFPLSEPHFAYLKRRVKSPGAFCQKAS